MSNMKVFLLIICSVADPDPYLDPDPPDPYLDPDPPDPHVLGLLDPDSDPLVTGMDPDPDPSIIKQNSKKNLDFYCFVTSF
jgi:hypothetical protein